MATAPRRRGGLLRLGLLLAGCLAAGWLITGLVPSLNPFKTKTVDRSPPAVLKSVQRLSEFRAATANLQQVVDVEEDASFLPDFIKGSKRLIVVSGRVDAVVDFSRLGKDAVQVSEDRRSATLRLPSPRLADPQLDLERTRVYDADRGLIDRVDDALGDDAGEEQELLLLAQRKMREAAAADPGTLALARENTRQMLTGLLRGLGFRRVTITFDPPAV